MKGAVLCGLGLLAQQVQGVVLPTVDEYNEQDDDSSEQPRTMEALMEFGEDMDKGMAMSARVNTHSQEFQQAVKEAAKKEVGKVLEDKMKFFPAMTSYAQLLEWNTSVAGPRVGPSKLPIELPNGRRILSMHDMAGGYQELADNDYMSMFKSWPLVDLFVYFSHCRIGVPPTQWTSVAHEHGRPAMGTLIFEGSNAADSKLIKENREQVISKLVEVADHYGFDGWFVNVEGGEWGHGDPEKFVGELKTALKEKVGKNSQVIAYPYGPEDKMFQAADGVFMQYNWDTSPESMEEVAKSAGERKHDVYMGTDSFGGFRGNDQPDPKHVQACRDHDVSLAVFAPGVTLEKGAQRKVSLLAVDYDERYWESIAKNFGRDVPSSGEWPVTMGGDGKVKDGKASSSPEAAAEHSLTKEANKAPTNGAALPDPEMAVMKRYAAVTESSHSKASAGGSGHASASLEELAELPRLAPKDLKPAPPKPSWMMDE
eukprot:TRINITY_DN12908_c0_g2_i1.p1 TRINITY_DN12908_c0_g2~~TRINITY_DN12908_c0_g2_i1.p1  ORF type:complete len:484 (+),score=153.44 TRINITY_DN12908_c0_g2_i1:80-1531(+)